MSVCLTSDLITSFMLDMQLKFYPNYHIIFYIQKCVCEVTNTDQLQISSSWVIVDVCTSLMRFCVHQSVSYEWTTTQQKPTASLQILEQILADFGGGGTEKVILLLEE